MRKDNNMIIQLQRYYALWKECTAMYEEWSKDQGLSSNGIFALYSFYESNGRCTQKMISEEWNIPKQTVNTILKDFQKRKGWKGHYEKEMADSPGADVCSLPVWDDDFLCNG